MPCQDWLKLTTSYPPVASLAIFSAASLASAPVVSSRVLARGAGVSSSSLRARSTTGRLSIPLNRWSSVPIDSRTVATTSGCEWPRMALICPDVKSRMARPSVSYT